MSDSATLEAPQASAPPAAPIDDGGLESELAAIRSRNGSEAATLSRAPALPVMSGVDLSNFIENPPDVAAEPPPNQNQNATDSSAAADGTEAAAAPPSEPAQPRTVVDTLAAKFLSLLNDPPQSAAAPEANQAIDAAPKPNPQAAQPAAAQNEATDDPAPQDDDFPKLDPDVHDKALVAGFEKIRGVREQVRTLSAVADRLVRVVSALAQQSDETHFDSLLSEAVAQRPELADVFAPSRHRASDQQIAARRDLYRLRSKAAGIAGLSELFDARTVQDALLAAVVQKHKPAQAAPAPEKAQPAPPRDEQGRFTAIARPAHAAPPRSGEDPLAKALAGLAAIRSRPRGR